MISALLVSSVGHRDSTHSWLQARRMLAGRAADAGRGWLLRGIRDTKAPARSTPLEAGAHGERCLGGKVVLATMAWARLAGVKRNREVRSVMVAGRQRDGTWEDTPPRAWCRPDSVGTW